MLNSNPDVPIIPTVKEYFCSLLSHQLVPRCEQEAMDAIRKGTAPKVAFKQSGCYYNSYDKNYARLMKREQRRLSKNKSRSKKAQKMKKSSIQTYRKELNRTVLELKQGKKRTKELEETVKEFQRRYFWLSCVRVV